MATESTDLYGIVRGKTIELDRHAGLPDGQHVAITVRPLPNPSHTGDGIRSSAGSWSDDTVAIDSWLEEIQHSRQLDRPEVG
jgi:hypothetical protein